MTTISQRIKSVLDLLKADDDISNAVNANIYSDGVLEEFVVPAIYVSYREFNELIAFGDVNGNKRFVDRSIYTIKVYTKKSSEAIAIAEKIKQLLIKNNFRYVDGMRIKDDRYFVFILEFRKIMFGGG